MSSNFFCNENHIFSTELIKALRDIMKQEYVNKCEGSDLQALGLCIAKYVFMKEVLKNV